MKNFLLRRPVSLLLIVATIIDSSLSIVSCPASLSHAEKESGETRIQFWFHTYVTYSDTGTMNVIISDGAITV